MRYLRAYFLRPSALNGILLCTVVPPTTNSVCEHAGNSPAIRSAKNLGGEQLAGGGLAVPVDSAFLDSTPQLCLRVLAEDIKSTREDEHIELGGAELHPLSLSRSRETCGA